MSVSSTKIVCVLCVLEFSNFQYFVQFSSICFRRASGKWLPICHSWLIECHKVNLTRWSTFGTAEKYFVVSFAEEFEPLSFLMHKNSIQMTRFYRTNLRRRNRTNEKKNQSCSWWHPMTFHVIQLPLLLCCPSPLFDQFRCMRPMLAFHPTEIDSKFVEMLSHKAIQTQIKLPVARYSWIRGRQCSRRRLHCHSTEVIACHLNWAMQQYNAVWLDLESGNH